MTNPELAPDMPELLPCPFCGGEVTFYKNMKKWDLKFRNDLDFIAAHCAHGCFTTYPKQIAPPSLSEKELRVMVANQINTRADLAPQAGPQLTKTPENVSKDNLTNVDVSRPQAGSVDVEKMLTDEEYRALHWGLNIAIVEAKSEGFKVADILERIKERHVDGNLPNPGPQGWREKDRALVAAYNYINASPQELLDVGKSREDFLKEFHTYCPNLPSPPNKETISGAPVGGDRPAIPGLQEAQGWQTVENVPRDQDVLVGYLNHAGEVEDVSVAYVSEGEKYHINSIYAEPRGDCRHCGGACKRVYVTHWMPLPAAPRDGRD